MNTALVVLFWLPINGRVAPLRKYEASAAPSTRVRRTIPPAQTTAARDVTLMHITSRAYLTFPAPSCQAGMTFGTSSIGFDTADSAQYAAEAAPILWRPS